MNARGVGRLTVFICFALLAGPRLPAQSPDYHVVKTVPVGGEGFWDYLTADGPSGRLYVSRGSHVMVIDMATMKVVGDIPGTNGVHGIAVASEFNRGFTSDGGDTTATIFDLETLKTISKVQVTGAGPDAILYDPFTKRAFTMNHSGGSATAIDAATGKVVGTAAIGGVLETGQSDNAGTIYVNVESKSEIAAFDARTMAVKAHWPLTGCEGPSGLAIDREHGRLFASCGESHTMDVMDYHTGRIVATLPICVGTDAAGFDPGLQLAFASCGDGSITAVHEDSPDKFTVVQTIATERGARTMAVDETTHKLYTVTAQFGPQPAPVPGETRRRRPPMIPGSFQVLVVDRQG
jgi:DNA-binding beta-propeller fold protein YncE